MISNHWLGFKNQQSSDSGSDLQGIPFRVISIKLDVEAVASGSPNEFGLPDWRWTVKLLNKPLVEQMRDPRDHQTFQQDILARIRPAATSAEVMHDYCRLKLLLEHFGLWNTDLFQDKDDSRIPCAILVNNLFGVLDKIYRHPAVLSARANLHCPRQYWVPKLPNEVCNLISVFDRIWIPSHEAKPIFSYLKDDAGPEWHALLLMSRPFPIEVWFYDGESVTYLDAQETFIRYSTGPEGRQWCGGDGDHENKLASTLRKFRAFGGGYWPIYNVDPALKAQDSHDQCIHVSHFQSDMSQPLLNRALKCFSTEIVQTSKTAKDRESQYGRDYTDFYDPSVTEVPFSAMFPY